MLTMIAQQERRIARMNRSEKSEAIEFVAAVAAQMYSNGDDASGVDRYLDRLVESFDAADAA